MKLDKLVTLIVLLWAILQLAFIGRGMVDSDEGVALAQGLGANVLHNGVYDYAQDKPPVFPLLMIALVGLNSSILFSRLFFIFFSSMTGLLTYSLAKKLSRSETVGRLSTILLLTHPYYFTYAGTVSLTILFSFLTTLFVERFVSKKYMESAFALALSVFTFQPALLYFLAPLVKLREGGMRTLVMGVTFSLLLFSVFFSMFGIGFLNSAFLGHGKIIEASTQSFRLHNKVLMFSRAIVPTPIFVFALVGLFVLPARNFILALILPYLLFFVIYPFTFPSHLFAMIPFVSIFSASGIEWISRKSGSYGFSLVAVFLSILSLISYPFVTSHLSSSMAEYEEIGTYVASLTSFDDYIFSDDDYVYFYAFRKPPVFNYTCDMKSLYTGKISAEYFNDLTSEFNIKVIAVGRRLFYFQEFMLSLPKNYSLVRTFPESGIEIWLRNDV